MTLNILLGGPFYKRRELYSQPFKNTAVTHLNFCRYLTADYERRNFSISQCSWTPNAQQDIVTIPSIASHQQPPVTNQQQSQRISAGVIAGVVIGSILALCATLYTLYYFRPAAWRGSKLEKDINEIGINEKTIETRAHSSTCEIDGAQYIGQEIEGNQYFGHEINGDQYLAQKLDRKPNQIQELPAGEFFVSELPH